MNRKKIIMVITSFGAGGAELLVKNLAINLDRTKFKVSVWAMNRYAYGSEQTAEQKEFEENFITELEKNGITAIIINTSFSKNRINRILKLKEELRKEKPDIVHCHSETVTAYILFASLGLDHKTIQTIHTSKVSYSVVTKLLKNKINKFVTISKQVKKEFLSATNFDKNKIINIYNGIDIEKYKYIDPKINEFANNKIKFLAVGRLNKAKNYTELLKAFAKLKNQDTMLYIAGTGELEQDLEQLAIDLKLEDRVVFMGIRNDIPQLLNKMDIFVLASVREGCPLSLTEAAASGIPIVTSALPVSEELLENIDNKIISNGYNCENLCESLEKSLNMQREPKNYQKVQKFDIKSFVKHHEILYNEQVKEFRTWNKIKK